MTINNKGFSLIELIFYIGILTFLTVIVMDTLASTTRLSTSQGNEGAATRSVITILNRINRGVKSADSASVVNGELVLDGEAFDLTQFVETGVSFDNLNFDLTDGTSSTMVRTTFTLNGKDYYSTSVLRHKP